MSNKIVPQVYRQIINEVMENIQVDFEEYGMEEDVLINLQAKWEAKLLETRVADFQRAPAASGSPEGDSSVRSSPPAPSISSHGMPPGLAVPAIAGPSRLHGAYNPGLALPGSNGLALPGASHTGLALPGQQGGAANAYQTGRRPDADDVLRIRGGAIQDEDELKPLSGDVKPEPNAAGLLPGDDIIDSDLDDSDDDVKEDADEDGEADVDIVFCVYDKVQRVKNKWKTTFKDGMVHINGRDYLFAKCTGEFEW